MPKPIFSYIAEIADSSPKDSIFTCIEIGACDGFHSQILSSILRMYTNKFLMHSFEPVESLYPVWKQWCANHLNHIKFFNKVVGCVDGVVPFFVSSGKDYYGSSSIRAPKLVISAFPEMKFSNTTVQSTRLDTHCKNNSIYTIDFIWMDVQGAERDVFEGANDILRRTRYIYTEYVNAEHYEGEYTLPQLLLQLGDNWVIVEDYGGDVLLKNTAF